MTAYLCLFKQPTDDKQANFSRIKKNIDIESAIGHVNDKSNGEEKKTDRSFPIIGIGGSAGSFKALERFFLHMPVDTGVAFIIIMHLDPNHTIKVSELFQKYTSMPVLQAEDNMEVEKDHVYVIPPNKDMGIHDRKLLLLNHTKSGGPQMPIDYF
ncbi:MAG: hypothetical protein JWR02_2853, partial [Mucilaginibacter sp.]|nr:hypothetical protein [Mucilaginibacter sp.]